MSKAHINNPYRKIYKEHFGEIPEGYHIHHIDFNPHNNEPSNLVALTPEEHVKVHDHEGVKWCIEAGRMGGKVSYGRMSEQEKKEWHSKGGMKSINSGGYKMSDSGKNNIKEARMKTIRRTCPYGCKTKRGNIDFDPGNYKLHMKLIHGEDVHPPR
jgi:hypothetical protein